MCVINQVGRSIPFTIRILSTYVDLGLAIQATHGPFQHQEGQDRPTSSFKNKLIGEIPGAFIQAFDFSETMDEDEESDDELATTRDGFVAVSLSKSTKKRIRATWSKAMIVKVYGRFVGFSFMQTKLLSLWKPAGRIDCVDLGKEFFLVRFSLKED